MATLDTRPRPPIGALRDAVGAPVVLPGEAGWDAARTPWNLAVDQRPEAVVLARTAADVQATVRFALAGGLQVVPQGTGHGAAPMGDLSGAILLRTTAMRAVEIRPEARIARAEAGAEWTDVVGPATAHGLVPLHGSSPDVGVDRSLRAHDAAGLLRGARLARHRRRSSLSSAGSRRPKLPARRGLDRLLDYPRRAPLPGGRDID